MIFKFISGTMTAADLDKQVEELKRGLGTPVQTSELDFAQRLKNVTKRQLAARSNRVFGDVSPSADDESFDQKLKRAVQKHPKSKENAQKIAVKARARYQTETAAATR